MTHEIVDSKELYQLRAEVARLREALEWATAHVYYPDPDVTDERMEAVFQENMNRAIAALSDIADDRIDGAVLAITANANENQDKTPSLRTLLAEIAEYAYAVDGDHEHQPDYELIQIGGIVTNLLRAEWRNDG